MDKAIHLSRDARISYGNDGAINNAESYNRLFSFDIIIKMLRDFMDYTLDGNDISTNEPSILEYSIVTSASMDAFRLKCLYCMSNNGKNKRDDHC